MKWLGITIGALMFMAGGALALVSGLLNSQTPIQVGPAPVIGGGVVAMIGLIIFLSHI